MFNPFPLFVGLRHFQSGSGSRLVSFISLLAIIGLVLGVALMIVVMSIMNGFDRELETRILNTVPHVRILAPQGIANWQSQAEAIARHPNVRNVSPFSEQEGLLSFRGKLQPVLLRGVTADTGSDTGFVEQFIGTGLWQKLLASGGTGVLMTHTIADRLQAKIGDRVTLLIPRVKQQGVQSLAPQFKALTVVGFFATKTGLDETLVVSEIALVNQLAAYGDRPQGLKVQLQDLFQARVTGFEILRMMPSGYRFSDWIQTHGNLYQAIKMSRDMVSLLVFLIIAIAVFNIISMLVMTVFEKRAAIAILKTLGASKLDIVLVFLTQGLMIGLTGTLLGAGLGVFLSSQVSALTELVESIFDVSLISAEVYPIDYLPSVLAWRDIAAVVLVAMLLNVLATVYPAWQAARTRPAEVLRYE